MSVSNDRLSGWLAHPVAGTPLVCFYTVARKVGLKKCACQGLDVRRLPEPASSRAKKC